MATKRCPEDWTPDDKLRSWTEKSCPDVIRAGVYWSELEKMKDHEFKRAYADWNAVARNWLRKAQGELKKLHAPVRNTYVAPPDLDRFDFCANQAFLKALKHYWPIPEAAVDDFKHKSRKMRNEFRVMEEEDAAPDDAACLVHFKKLLKQCVDNAGTYAAVI